MRYVGGKFSMAKHLAEAILPYRAGLPGLFWEPFCGGLSATAARKPDIASDASFPLIRMYRAVREGWTPPEVVTEDEYQRIRREVPEDDPLYGFVAFGCSFGGKFWGGYAREGKRGNRNFARDSWNSLARKFAQIPEDTWLICEDYAGLEFGKGDLVYCDPPYAKTTNGYSVKDWNPDAFWAWADRQASQGAVLFVSEYAIPDGLTADDIHLAVPSRTDLHTTKRAQEVTEHLFLLGKENLPGSLKK